VKRTLSTAEARATYDRIGSLQDTQGFYEDVPVRQLTELARFEDSLAVVEFGCGTGRQAKWLLEHHLPERARYLALDQSTTMVGLATSRLQPWANRAEVRQTDGSIRIDAPDEHFDRFFSTYVLDLLSHEDIAKVLAEAHRVLTDDGLLCLTGLTYGTTMLQRALVGGLVRLHAWQPKLVGGCRPVDLRAFLAEQDWRLVHHAVVSRFGVPSEVLVASPVRG
jgi:ubiquinone/menaquinone biosynthesis C-methylase UbiE